MFALFLQVVQELQKTHSSHEQNSNEVISKGKDNHINAKSVDSASNTVNNTNDDIVNRPKRLKKMKDPKCANLEAFTIYPDDSARVVRKKQGNCI